MNFLIRFSSLLLGFSASLFSIISSPLLGQCPELVWADEFEGMALDAAKWSHQLGDGCAISTDLCGWGNNELQWYQSQNATVEDGILKIVAKRETVQNRSYTSARIRSKDLGDWTYGRFEAAIKLPQGKGIWPAFWMLPTDEVYGGWPQSGEIDIVELIGQEPEVVHGTIHYGNLWPGNQSLTEAYTLHDGIFNDDFHKFAVEWAPGEIRWLVDDYLYAVKRSSDVLPFSWPFDQDFHLLLNVAVGGNWPGNPDATTAFPQTMEVDYVRVYADYAPYLTGNRKVRYQASDEIYTISQASENATFAWTAPPGATITDGQNTNTVTVDWGDQGGALEVVIEDGCGAKKILLDVLVEPALDKVLSFENFDDPARISFNRSTGTFADEVSNPDPNDINASELVGSYTRNGSEQYDVLVYNVQDLGDASLYTNGSRKFYIDVYTDAPVGTQILLQLENSQRTSPTNYPTGRHSRFEAFTSVQNEWEQLEFQWLDQPDVSTTDLSVDQFIFLFASNTFTDNTFYFDNFDAYAQAGLVSTKYRGAADGPLVRIMGNPAGAEIVLYNLSDSPISRYQLFDYAGRIVAQAEVDLSPNNQIAIPATSLSAGLYFLQVYTRDQRQSIRKVVVN